MLYVYSMDPSFLWLHVCLQAPELASCNDCSTGPKHLELTFFLADPSVGGGEGAKFYVHESFFFCQFSFALKFCMHVFCLLSFKVASPTIVSLPSENCVK